MTYQSRRILRVKNRKIYDVSGAFIFYCESKCDLQNDPIYDRKMEPDVLTLSTTFYELSVSSKTPGFPRIREPRGTSRTQPGTRESRFSNPDPARNSGPGQPGPLPSLILTAFL